MAFSGPGHSAMIVGSLLVAVSALLGLPLLYWNTFVDEGDSFAVATLVLHGNVLYRDIFSHHFPLVYDWLAWTARVAAPSVTTYRASVLVFQTLCFGLALRLGDNPLAVGLTAVAWRFLSPLYHGNLAIHSVFSASLLFPLTVVGLSWVQGRSRPSGSQALVVGALAGLAFLNDPLTLPISALVFLATLARSLRATGWAGVSFLIVVTAALVRLLVLDSWDAFWRCAVQFNLEVYLRYLGVAPWERLWKIASSALEVADPRWWHAAWFPLGFPDRAWFTGGFFRAVTLLAVLVELFQRRIFAALWLYGLAVFELSLLGQERFRAASFVLLALFLGARFAAGTAPGFSSRTRLLFRALCVAPLLWIAVASAVQMYTLRQYSSYQTSFGRYERQAAWLRSLACLRGTKLGWYPADPYLHFFTGLEPLGGFLFLFPWVAEVGMHDVVEAAKNGRALLYVDLDGEVWGHRNRDYLAELYRFAKQNYVEVARSFFVSKDVADACLRSSDRAEPGPVSEDPLRGG